MMAFAAKPNMNCRCRFILMALLVCIMTHNAFGHANLETEKYGSLPKIWSPLMSLLGDMESMEDDYENYENIVIGKKYPTAMQKFLILSNLMDYDEGIRKNTNNEMIGEQNVRLKNFKRNILRGKQTPVKAYSMKKNVQYMSPCHFKICHIGKRIAPDYSNF